MKKIINGKLYDTETAEEIFSEDCDNCGNFSGTDDLFVTKKGTFFVASFSNGQDLYRSSGLALIGDKEAALEWLSGREITDEECEKLGKLGLIIEG